MTWCRSTPAMSVDRHHRRTTSEILEDLQFCPEVSNISALVPVRVFSYLLCFRSGFLDYQVADSLSISSLYHLSLIPDTLCSLLLFSIILNDFYSYHDDCCFHHV